MFLNSLSKHGENVKKKLQNYYKYRIIDVCVRWFIINFKFQHKA
jgi:hypothetical protein